MALLVVIAVALGAALAGSLAALVRCRRHRRGLTEALAEARWRTVELEGRVAATQAEVLELAAARAALEQRTHLLDEGLARGAERTAAAEARAQVAMAELRDAVEREEQLRVDASALAARVASLEERLAAGAGVPATGADDELVRHLWDLELARVEREWRLDAGPLSGDGPLVEEPLLDDGRAFERALGMEVHRLHEEVGVAVELRPDLAAPPEPRTALLGLRLAQELLAVGARRLEAIEVDLTADGANLVLGVSGDGGVEEADRLRRAPGVAAALTGLGGTLAVGHHDGRVEARLCIPTGR